MRNPFKYFKTSPEIIRLAVMMYIRFPRSMRHMEGQLRGGGILVPRRRPPDLRILADEPCVSQNPDSDLACSPDRGWLRTNGLRARARARCRLRWLGAPSRWPSAIRMSGLPRAGRPHRAPVESQLLADRSSWYCSSARMANFNAAPNNSNNARARTVSKSTLVF